MVQAGQVAKQLDLSDKFLRHSWGDTLSTERGLCASLRDGDIYHPIVEQLLLYAVILLTFTYAPFCPQHLHFTYVVYFV
jgi:hypothetical protein